MNRKSAYSRLGLSLSLVTLMAVGCSLEDPCDNECIEQSVSIKMGKGKVTCYVCKRQTDGCRKELLASDQAACMAIYDSQNEGKDDQVATDCDLCQVSREECDPATSTYRYCTRDEETMCAVWVTDKSQYEEKCQTSESCRNDCVFGQSECIEKEKVYRYCAKNEENGCFSWVSSAEKYTDSCSSGEEPTIECSNPCSENETECLLENKSYRSCQKDEETGCYFWKEEKEKYKDICRACTDECEQGKIFCDDTNRSYNTCVFNAETDCYEWHYDESMYKDKCVSCDTGCEVGVRKLKDGMCKLCVTDEFDCTYWDKAPLFDSYQLVSPPTSGVIKLLVDVNPDNGDIIVSWFSLDGDTLSLNFESMTKEGCFLWGRSLYFSGTYTPADIGNTNLLIGDNNNVFIVWGAFDSLSETQAVTWQLPFIHVSMEQLVSENSVTIVGYSNGKAYLKNPSSALVSNQQFSMCSEHFPLNEAGTEQGVALIHCLIDGDSNLQGFVVPGDERVIGTYQTNPRLAINEDNQLVVVWQEVTTKESRSHVRYSVLNSSMSISSFGSMDFFDIEGESQIQTNPALALGASKSMLVVYEEDSPDAEKPSKKIGGYVYQKINGSTNYLKSTDHLLISEANNPHSPDACYLKNGTGIVVYSTDENDGDVMYNKINGGSVSEAAPISSTVDGSQRSHALTCFDNRFVTAYLDDSDGDGQYNVMLKQIEMK